MISQILSFLSMHSKSSEKNIRNVTAGSNKLFSGYYQDHRQFSQLYCYQMICYYGMKRYLYLFLPLRVHFSPIQLLRLYDHFDILATDVSKFNLLVKETLLIKRNNPVLNRTTKLFPLELFDQFYYHCFLVLYQILLSLYPSD